jgi:hypothetical protein
LLVSPLWWGDHRELLGKIFHVTPAKVASNQAPQSVTEVSVTAHKSLLLNLLAVYPSARVPFAHRPQERRAVTCRL